MTSYVALLRGVNLGPHKRVAMAELRATVSELGYADVRTLLQSGNVVFRAGDRNVTTTLEKVVAHVLESRLGLRTDVMIRTAEEWSAVVAHNPFPSEAERDPAHLVVVCCNDAPAAADVAALEAAITGREIVRARGRELYAVYPDGIGESKLTAAVIDRTLRTRGTARNWNTVLKLSALASG